MSFSQVRTISTYFLVVCSAPLLIRSTEASLPTPVQITNLGAVSGPLSVSPVGEKLLVKGSSNMLILSLAGTPLDTVGSQSGSYDWTQDGTRFVAGDGGFIAVVDPQINIFEPFPGPAVNNGISWSPLGNGAVYQDSDLGLMFFSYPSGSVAAIPCSDPDATGCEGEWPSFSGDGAWIAFEDGTQILRVSAGGGTAEIVVDLPGDVTTPAYSPDGHWIAFSRTVAGEENNLWVCDARGSQFGLVQLTEGTYRDLFPDWSPDSRDIYFISDRSGPFEVWKVTFDGSVPALPMTWGRIKARFQ